MKKLLISIKALILLLALNSSGFNPPTDTAHGVTMTIEGFPEKGSIAEGWSVTEVNAATPLNFNITLLNKSQGVVSGRVKVWLNDDWQVSAGANTTVNLNPGATKTIACQARAFEKVHHALYPIHATLEFKHSEGNTKLHPIAIFKAILPSELTSGKSTETEQQKLTQGLYSLDNMVSHRVFINHKDKVQELGLNFQGSDKNSGASLAHQSIARGGITRHSIAVHPPYYDRAGVIWSDYELTLPANQTAQLRFYTAVRDVRQDEVAGDGTEHRVIVVDNSNQEHEIFNRFSNSKKWLPGSADLTPWAGKRITLRLWTGSGPDNNSSCDLCYWGDLLLAVGTPHLQLEATGEEQWQKREAAALSKAEAALLDKSAATAAGAFKLDVHDTPFGVGIALGKQGLLDGVITFTDGTEKLFYRGFNCAINRMLVGGNNGTLPVARVTTSHKNNALIVTHEVNLITAAGKAIAVSARARIWQEGSALAVAWDMPQIKRDHRGLPRYTLLGLGTGSESPWRSYAGFGHVVENPGSFTLNALGYTLSTRHIGADYPSGLSLVQACDVYPTRINYDKESQLFALETSHDARFFFIPSTKGAFAAARAYREISGFKKGAGVDQLLGRVCLDEWSGDFKKAAEGLQKAGRYGLNHAIFVKHDWQHWGYDYRLPEIYPPRPNLEEMLLMRRAAADAGMLFCPHDNYTDFYPDAAGYSYNHIVFHEGNQPKMAWLNHGRLAQSYLWLPHAIHPSVKKNMHLMRQGFYPDSLFIDVLTNMAPFDYYDRAGNFYPLTRTAAEWCLALNTARTILKKGAPMLSETGTDALIGSVDGTQADHIDAKRLYTEYEHAERTPWHDMATHGKMVLFAGGLGARYSAIDRHVVNRPKHGYGSDDYLSNTVLGGRNPMCEGPFSRAAVMTYWLLHDVCDVLARAELETHTFGNSIYQQHTTFGSNNKVWVNRGTNQVWQVADNKHLPQYGFYVTTPQAEAGVYLISGHRAALARSPGVLFVDARPPFFLDKQPMATSSVRSATYSGDGVFNLLFDWSITQPITEACRPFIHICSEHIKENEQTAFQATAQFDPAILQTKTNFTAAATITVPPEMPAGTYTIRYGLYNPVKGGRVKIRAFNDYSGRVKGGKLKVEKQGIKFVNGTWEPEQGEDDFSPGIYNSKKLLDFGPLITDGAFRLLHDKQDEWTLIPLPGSYSFKAQIRLNEFMQRVGSVKSVEAIDPGAAAEPPKFNQQGDNLYLKCDGNAFAYRIIFSGT